MKILFFLFTALSFSLDVCVYTNAPNKCPASCSSCAAPADFSKLLLKYTKIHLNLFIKNKIDDVVKLNLSQLIENQITIALRGNKKSSFISIDYCNLSHDNIPSLSYHNVTVFAQNSKDLSFGQLYTKNVNFDFSGKINNNKRSKSFVTFNETEENPVFIGSLFLAFNGVRIYEDRIVFFSKTQVGTMSVHNFINGSAYLTVPQSSSFNEFYFYSGENIDKTINLPFVSINVSQKMDVFIGEFPIQPNNGLPPIGLVQKTQDLLNVRGVSSVSSKFVYFGISDGLKKSFSVEHSDIYPMNYFESGAKSITLDFSTLSIENGVFRKATKSDLRINALKLIKGSAFAFQEVSAVETTESPGISFITLIPGQNMITIKSNEVILSKSDGSQQISFGVDSNSIIGVRQRATSESNLIVVTENGQLETLAKVEIYFSKTSTLTVKSALSNDVLPRVSVYSSNVNNPVTIKSENKAGFLFGETDEFTSNFVLNGASVYGYNENSTKVCIGKLFIQENNEFVKLNGKFNLLSINDLTCDSEMINIIPNYTVYKNFYIKGQIKSGQVVKCQPLMNAYIDLPAGYNKISIDSVNGQLLGDNGLKITFSNITAGKIYLNQLKTSSTSFVANLIVDPTNSSCSPYCCFIFEFSNEVTSENTFQFLGDSWSKVSNEVNPLVRLVTSHKLTVTHNDGSVPASFCGRSGSDLVLKPASNSKSVKYHNLELASKSTFLIDSDLSVDVFSLSLNSSASFATSSTKTVSISASHIDFELGAFGTLDTSNWKFAASAKSVSLRGNNLNIDKTIQIDKTYQNKCFALGDLASNGQISVSSSEIVYIINSHKLTFVGFEGNVSISTKGLGTETKISSLTLNENSTFLYSNSLALNGGATLNRGSKLNSLENGKIIFSKSDVLTSFYDLDNLPSIGSKTGTFESMPSKISFKFTGKKTAGDDSKSLLNKINNSICASSFDCEALLSVVDVEHPFSDFQYKFEPICSDNYINNLNSDDGSYRCIALVMRDIAYTPTQSKVPTPVPITTSLTTTSLTTTSSTSTSLTTSSLTTTSSTTSSETKTTTAKSTSGDETPQTATTSEDDGGDADEAGDAGKTKKIVITVVSVVLIIAIGAVVGFFLWRRYRRSSKVEFETVDPKMTQKILSEDVQLSV